MPLSIRLRLTLLYTAILGVTLIVFAMVVYTLLVGNLTREIDASLRVGADASARFLGANRPAGVARDNDRSALARIVAERNGTLPPIATFPELETYVQVVDPSGKVLTQSLNLSGAGLVLPPPPSNTRQRQYSDITVADQALRLLVQPITGGPYSGDFLEVARRLSDVQQTLDRFRVILALGMLGALLVAGVAGWLLATTALRPINRLTQAAHEIGAAQDFGRRVPYQGPRDELGRLAGTFNEMLGRLEAAYARIQSALEAQRRFVADASHELRTPLTTIRGNVELLELDTLDESPERQEALHDIASEAERMSRLVTDLLVLARADAGLHIRRNPVELRPLVEEVFRQVRRMEGNVTFELEEVPDVVVNGSADHLKQLLLILLDNAHKYSPAGGTVQLSGEQANGWVRLSVSDEGAGIPSGEQERIFDRFYRLDPSRHGEGAGLGLSIARWIVMEHDGSLSVKSKPGDGSTFSFSLPLSTSRKEGRSNRLPTAADQQGPAEPQPAPV